MPLRPRYDVSAIVAQGERIQKEATPYGINRVFDDGGYRELILFKLFGLQRPPGQAVRTGDDAVDPVTGQLYELKTVNFRNLSGEYQARPQITTCHHFNQHILDRYRSVKFIIGFFHVNTPVRIYEVDPKVFEHPYFQRWEQQLAEVDHLNNPKFAPGPVVKYGTLIWRNPNPEFEWCFETLDAA